MTYRRVTFPVHSLGLKHDDDHVKLRVVRASDGAWAETVVRADQMDGERELAYRTLEREIERTVFASSPSPAPIVSPGKGAGG